MARSAAGGIYIGPVLLVFGLAFIAVPGMFFAFLMWLQFSPAEAAFIDEVESSLGELQHPRDVLDDAKRLCSSFEGEAEGYKEFNEESRIYSIRKSDNGAVHGEDGPELTEDEALVIIDAAEKHFCGGAD